MRLFLSLALPLAFLAACRPEGETKYVIDADGDGVKVDDDCDDSDADQGAAVDWWADADGDGVGGGESTTSCKPDAGAVEVGGDCDDADGSVYPGATEVCDGVDQDCDGVADDGLETVTSYTDADGDGFGDVATASTGCAAVEGNVLDGTDCNDADPAYHPGADETDCTDTNDYNCDGSVGYADADSDGFAACEECDDAMAAVNPDAIEACNGYDDDCDSVIDESDASDATIWYTDADGDGYGDPASEVVACEAPEGAVASGDDCDDADAAYHPGADESDCSDAHDYNCDGSVAYADNDADGYAACEECDDADATQYPGAIEVCNGEDDDCNGLSDDGAVDATIWYADTDGDSFGDVTSTTTACDAPTGSVADSTDCDDDDGAVNPAATEACNSIDDDCDGDVDEAGATGETAWYDDGDSDGFGAGTATTSCDAPAGSVANNTDCDDIDALVNRDATEACNGYDDNCDGTIDEAGALGESDWYDDSDSDGYGAGAASTSCDPALGQVAVDGDCDDLTDTIYPGAPEHCDGVDEDCDGTADNGAVDASTWYSDADADGYGDPRTSVDSCDAPADTIADGTDCDDTDPRSQPGADEICDGADNDCDGTIDEACIDAILIPSPSGDPVVGATNASACTLLGELSSAADSHSSANLASYMSQLVGTTSGLLTSVAEDAEPLDYSIRCGTNYTASVGNYSPTNAWPSALSGGSYGAGRFRGYLNIGASDPLNVTMGLIGNDAVSLTIEGTSIATVNWADGRWKKFRYVSFPEPGIYSFEIRWSTNLICDIDPMEVVWATGFVAGYDDYDTMCASATCTYGNGVAIPGFTVIDADNLVQATDGSDTTCDQCESDTDCLSTEVCNSAGVCE